MRHTGESFQVTIHLLLLIQVHHNHVIHTGFTVIQSRTNSGHDSEDFAFFQPGIKSGSGHWQVPQILGKSNIFFTCFAADLLFWPQKTTLPETPQAVVPQAVAHNPPVPVVRDAIVRVGMKIRVSFFFMRVHFLIVVFFFL